jgi:hypothetical protein
LGCAKLSQEPKVDKKALLVILARVRKCAEQGDLDIAAQNDVITALENRGIDATLAKNILMKLLAQQEATLGEMERLLDGMDGQDPISAIRQEA